MTKRRYEFDTQQEAQDYVDRLSACNIPSSEYYIQGPHFIDGNTLFSGASAPTGYVPHSYWVVSVEFYR